MITIAIPFYNAEKYFELSIKSVLEQTYTDWKLILIDDGSKDTSLTIARRYESLDNRIRVYSDGQNKHLAFRLNEIAKMTTTKYLVRMDADDIMHPMRIETQLSLLERHKEIDVLGTNAYSIDENNVIQGIRIRCDLSSPILINVKGFIHPTIMAKTEWFIANPYDIKVVRAQDYELWQRTASKSIFKVYTEPLLFYREFGNDYYKKYFKGVGSKFYVARKLKKTVNYYIAVSHLFKGLAYRVFNLLGKENILVNRRFYSISSETMKEAESTLHRIIA